MKNQPKSRTNRIADNYEREYGFMCVNATKKDAALLFSIHNDFNIHDEGSIAELKVVHDELLRRGRKIIKTEEEYNEGVVVYGLPKAFKRGEETK